MNGTDASFEVSKAIARTRELCTRIHIERADWTSEAANLTLPMYVQAAGWGLLASSGLVIGAVCAIAFKRRLSHRMIAAVMGFGGGVLIAVLAVNLMETAFSEGGPIAATLGFLSGATAFSAINWALAKRVLGIAIAAATA